MPPKVSFHFRGFDVDLCVPKLLAVSYINETLMDPHTLFDGSPHTSVPTLQMLLYGRALIHGDKAYMSKKQGAEDTISSVPFYLC